MVKTKTDTNDVKCCCDKDTGDAVMAKGHSVTSSVCPRCGYCPACGRGYNYFPFYPFYPYTCWPHPAPTVWYSTSSDSVAPKSALTSTGARATVGFSATGDVVYA